MLIEQLTGAVCARLFELAFGPGAAEPRTIGGSFLLRSFPCGSFFELFQIDQIAHAGPRHTGSAVVAAMYSIDEVGWVPIASGFGGYVQAGSIVIYEIPHYAV
jgi:hypothetical protein